MGHRKESTQCYSKTPQSGNTVPKSTIIMIMIITYCNYKSMVHIGLNLAQKCPHHPGDPDDRGTDYTGTAV